MSYEEKYLLLGYLGEVPWRFVYREVTIAAQMFWRVDKVEKRVDAIEKILCCAF